MLAYVMLTGISPFLGEDKQETFLNISQLNVSYTEEELQQLDQAALPFIQMLLRKQPQYVSTTHLTQSIPLLNCPQLYSCLCLCLCAGTGPQPSSVSNTPGSSPLTAR